MEEVKETNKEIKAPEASRNDDLIRKAIQGRNCLKTQQRTYR